MAFTAIFLVKPSSQWDLRLLGIMKVNHDFEIGIQSLC